MKPYLLRLVAIALFCLSTLPAQPVDDTQLKQVIIFGRHSVRAPVVDNATLDKFSAQPFPNFVVAPGILTSNGTKLETALGAYYRLWLKQEGLLSGNDSEDAALVYFRANVIERTITTAKAFATGLLPAAGVTVNHFSEQEHDPLFDAIGAGVSRLDQRKAVAAVAGRLGGNAQSLASALAPELALTRSILFGYPVGTKPVPATPQGKVDVTAMPFHIEAGTGALTVDLGGLGTVLNVTDPFIMQYAEGLPDSEVGWGHLTPESISQTSRFITVGMDLLFRTPYLAQVQSSNVASHVVRTMLQSATGNAMTGVLGNPSTKAIVLIASDINVTGLAGLFRLSWVLPGYQPDYCAPGGALVFELRQSQRTGAFFVRASYIAQTLDQLRNQTVLTLATPPARAPLFIPGCSARNATFDCTLTNFLDVAKQVIDPRSADRKD